MLLFEVGKKYKYIIKTKLISCTNLRKQQKYKNVNIKGYFYNSFLYHCEQDKTQKLEKEEEKEDEEDDVFYDMNSIVCFVVMTALLCALFQGLSFM